MPLHVGEPSPAQSKQVPREDDGEDNNINPH